MSQLGGSLTVVNYAPRVVGYAAGEYFQSPDDHDMMIKIFLYCRPMVRRSQVVKGGFDNKFFMKRFQI